MCGLTEGINYQALNELIIKSRYFLPQVDELLTAWDISMIDVRSRVR